MADTERELQDLAKALTAEFDHWNFLHEYGGYDPFHADGTNLNLTRNHIIAHKRNIERLMEGQQQELTLFPLSYPEIYYRETPPELPYEFMARADEIRNHAREQLALYNQNPDFCYIREHFKEAFPLGDTKATRAAGIHTGQFSYVNRCAKCIDRDDLVTMRSAFYPSYEEMANRFAESAALLREYLSRDHSQEDQTPIRDTYPDEDDSVECEPDMDEDVHPPKEPPKPSLDEQIRSARERTPEPEKSNHTKEDQLTLF